MFRWACVWNRYSLPSLRTGSPVHDSAGPSDREAHARPVQQACDRPGRLAGPFVERPGAPDPEEVLHAVGDRAVHDGDLEAEVPGPLEALGGPEPPRVAPVLHVAQHRSRLGRETGLVQDLVASHVDDGVDVLDVDRALLDARTAGRARPEHVVRDDVRHQRLRAFLANSSSRRSMTTSLGESALPVFQAGHEAWQRPHSVQVTRSKSCFQVNWSILPAPKTVSSSIVSRSISGVLSKAPRREGWRRVGDVQRCHEDVKVLGVDDQHQERHDHDDVQVDEDRFDGPVGGYRAAPAPDRARGRRKPTSRRGSRPCWSEPRGTRGA